MASVRGHFIYDGVRPPGLSEVYGKGRGLAPSWRRYVGALSAMGSAPPDRPIVYGTGSWSDPHGLPLILFCFRRGRLRVLRGELRLAGLDVLLDGLLRAFVDGTALLTAEGLHQAHVVGV